MGGGDEHGGGEEHGAGGEPLEEDGGEEAAGNLRQGDDEVHVVLVYAQVSRLILKCS